jgi:hypothetical protein
MLQEKGQVAVAIGVGTSGDAIQHLAPWADRIFVVEEAYSSFVPLEYRHKLVVLPLGADKWSNPYHPDLRASLERLYEQYLQKQVGST